MYIFNLQQKLIRAHFYSNPLRNGIFMIENKYTFQNKTDLEIFYHEWLPDDDNIRAVVLIVHGHGEHSGRYRHVAKSFTQVGLACYGIDHQGHGKSDGDRIFIPDMTLAVDDLSQLFDIVKEKYPDNPYLVFGHSMGSLISLQFVLRYQEQIKALALTGSAITGDESQPAWLIWLAIQAAKIIPRVRLSPPLPPTVLTTDDEQVKLWLADPLTDKGMWRIGTSAAMLTAGRILREQVHQLTLPMLVMHGGADKIVPSTGATYLEQHAQSDDITVKILPGLRHEVVNEVGRESIIQEITDWFVNHTEQN